MLLTLQTFLFVLSQQDTVGAPPPVRAKQMKDEHDLMFTLTSQASVQSALAPKPHPSRTLCSMALLSEGLKFLSSQQPLACCYNQGLEKGETGGEL